MTHTYNTLVVVDDNAAILTALKICLAAEFERIVTLTSPDTLVATLAKEEAVDAVLLDMNFSLGVNTGQDGLFWLRTIKKLHPNTPVILITAYADVQLAVKGLKYGLPISLRSRGTTTASLPRCTKPSTRVGRSFRSSRWSRNMCRELWSNATAI